MNLISRIPKDFYKVFGSKYMEFYMQFLVAVYEESSQSYSLLGLTEGECQAIMNEQLARMTLDWSEERFDEEGELDILDDLPQLLHRLGAGGRCQPLEEGQAGGVDVHGDGKGICGLHQVHLLPDGLQVPGLDGGHAAAAVLGALAHIPGFQSLDSFHDT